MSSPICQIAEALTVGVIARRLNAPVHRVTYVIRSRGLTPTAKAGASYVFEESDVRLIADTLSAIRARRSRLAIQRCKAREDKEELAQAGRKDHRL